MNLTGVTRVVVQLMGIRPREKDAVPQTVRDLDAIEARRERGEVPRCAEVMFQEPANTDRLLQELEAGELILTGANFEVPPAGEHQLVRTYVRFGRVPTQDALPAKTFAGWLRRQLGRGWDSCTVFVHQEADGPELWITVMKAKGETIADAPNVAELELSEALTA